VEGWRRVKTSPEKIGFVSLMMSILIIGLLSGCILSNPACDQYRDPMPGDGNDSQVHSPEDQEQRKLITENCLKRDLGIIQVK
jgi:hypothetical protein